MPWNSRAFAISSLLIAVACIPFVLGVTGAPLVPPPTDDSVKALVGRLDLERYKAAIKGLTQFGDRRQGTDRNRMAVDWIETQLRSYGCGSE
jgi:hypothetical protein